MPNTQAHIPVTTDHTIAIDLLAEKTNVSKQKLKDAMQKGAVWLSQTGRGKPRTRRLRRAKSQLPKGSEVHLYYDAHVLAQTTPPPQLISEQSEYSIWYKPAGTLSQGSKFGDHCAIIRQVEKDFNKPTYLVHRLDKAASGLILIAHSKSAAAKLSALFQNRTIEKHYTAGVSGVVTHTLPWHIDTPLEGKTASTIISTAKPASDVEETPAITWLEVVIETGRKHQIRQHLARVHLPIIGDTQYGGEPHKRLLLQADKLAFTCPLSQNKICVHTPEDLQLQAAETET